MPTGEEERKEKREGRGSDGRGEKRMKEKKEILIIQKKKRKFFLSLR